MVYIPVVRTGHPKWSEVAEDGFEDISLRLTVIFKDGSPSYEVPQEYLMKVDWIYETDVSGRSSPLDEMDVVLSNVSGIFDIDNPDSISDIFRQNGYIQAEMMIKHSDLDSYTFPMGIWIISERSYSDDNVTLVCYDTALPLTTSTDVLESNWDRYPNFIDQIQSCFEDNGTIVREFIKHKTNTPKRELLPYVKVGYGAPVGHELKNVKLLVGTYCFAGGSIRDDHSIPGVSLTVVGSAIMQIYANGVPNQIGYYYIPVFNISDISFYGYIQISIDGYSPSTVSGTQLLATFLKSDDEPSYVSETPTVSEQMRILMKTLFEAYTLKNTREGGYLYEPYIHKISNRFAGEFKNRVLEYPQLSATEIESTNVINVEYFSARWEDEQDVEGMVTKEYRDIQPSDVSILRDGFTLPFKQLMQEGGNPLQLTGEYWADRISEAYFQSGIRYPTFKMTLIGAPEIEPKDFIFVKGKYGVKPYYVKKITMTYDGNLISEVEGLLLSEFTWRFVKGHIWQNVKDDNTWGELLTVYKEFR